MGADSKALSRFAIGDPEWPGLSKLIEECGEVQQVCGKLMGTRGQVKHWDGSNLRERLTEELADLIAACEFVAAANHLDAAAIRLRVLKKRALFAQWHEHEDPPPPQKDPGGNHEDL